MILAKTPRTLLLLALLILFTQASVAGAMVHAAPASICGAQFDMGAGMVDADTSRVANAYTACKTTDSPDSTHAQHGSGDQGQDCCLDCECSLSHCSTSAAISQDGLAAWDWANRRGPDISLLPLNPPVSNLFRPPILG